MGEPAAEVNIDAELVSSLLSSQHPDLVGLGLKEVGSGWDNAIFRVGTDLAVRLPRRLMSVPLILHEQKWLSEIAPHLPAAIPVPLRAGAPGAGFPWPWSITPWFAGSTADRASLAEVQTCAGQLGLFLRSLHRPAPTDAPRNPCRGMPLAPRDQLTRPGIEALDEAIDHELVWRTWERLRDTPAWTGLPVWIHGDLHPFNLILSKGGLAAVIDWGDICAGDPATDLAVGWTLFSDDQRATFRDAVDVDRDTWARGRAWAIALGVTWANGGERLSPIGYRALAAACEGP